MSEFPTFTISELLEAGVHFGHKTMRWNPKMAPYIYGIRDDIHIIDLQQTAPLLYRALQIVADVVKNNGRVLFVGTKRQASDVIAEAAKRCGQYYVNHRWLGGMLTNWSTISVSIKTLRQLEEKLEAHGQADSAYLTKKEVLEIDRKRDKLERSLGGIRDMGGRPDLLFIVDTNKEDLAVKEAMKLGIPIIAIADSNSDPDGVNYPIPGNDDATRAIKLYCKLISDAALHGIQQGMVASGADIGAIEDVENNLAERLHGGANEGAGRRTRKTTATKPATATKAAAEKTTGTTRRTTTKKTGGATETAETTVAASSEDVQEVAVKASTN